MNKTSIKFISLFLKVNNPCRRTCRKAGIGRPLHIQFCGLHEATYPVGRLLEISISVWNNFRKLLRLLLLNVNVKIFSSNYRKLPQKMCCIGSSSLFLIISFFSVMIVIGGAIYHDCWKRNHEWLQMISIKLYLYILAFFRFIAKIYYFAILMWKYIPCWRHHRYSLFSNNKKTSKKMKREQKGKKRFISSKKN